ncbi:hypothetical protein ACTFIY_007724 [Dictyostelium cf. discoideum]
MKGRDQLWRFTLKALPKIYNNPCPHCEEDEISSSTILNQLQIALIANLIAIMFEKIWYKRNKLIHDGIEIIINKEQIIHEMIKTQRAAWERIQSIINKTLRIKTKQRAEEQNKLDSLISLKLLQYSRQWNSPLHTITLPKHLKEYNNSLSSLFK